MISFIKATIKNIENSKLSDILISIIIKLTIIETLISENIERKEIDGTSDKFLELEKWKEKRRENEDKRITKGKRIYVITRGKSS